MWVQHIAGSTKFHREIMKGLEERRKWELGRRSQDIAKLDLRY